MNAIHITNISAFPLYLLTDRWMSLSTGDVMLFMYSLLSFIHMKKVGESFKKKKDAGKRQKCKYFRNPCHQVLNTRHKMYTFLSHNSSRASSWDIMSQGDKQMLVVAWNIASCSFASFFFFLLLIFGFYSSKIVHKRKSKEV